MKRKHKEKSGKTKEEALAKFKEYLAKAKQVFKKDKAMANRYVTKARKAAMKVKLRIPRELKRQYCKHCYKLLVQGENCRVRTQRGKVVYYCMECKKYMRFPYKK